MAAANPQPLQARPFEDPMRGPIPIDDDEDDDYEDGAGLGGDDSAMDDLDETHINSVSVAEHGGGGGGGGGLVMASRTSELTLSFEGEVYVFPAVTPEKVCYTLSLWLFDFLFISIRGLEFKINQAKHTTDYSIFVSKKFSFLLE